MKFGREDYDRRINDQELIIPEDEPVFLLRAQDVCAADTVRYWADHAMEAGADIDMVEMAWDMADLMDEWPKKKTSDLP